MLMGRVNFYIHHLFMFFKVLEDDRTGDGDEAEDIYRRSRMNYKDIPLDLTPPPVTVTRIGISFGYFLVGDSNLNLYLSHCYWVGGRYKTSRCLLVDGCP